MKYKGRIIGITIGFFQSIAWWVVVELHNVNHIGGISRILATVIYSFIGWLIGIQYDKVVYYSRQNEELLKFKERTIRKVLDESEQRYQSLFVHNTDAILIFDLEERLVHGNPATEKLVGCKIEELKGYHYKKLVDEENTEVYQYYFQKAMEGKTQEYEIDIHTKQGEKRIVNVKVIPMILNQEIKGIFIILKDRTEEKKKDERLLRSEKLSMIGQLAAGVAHEIRNPLTTLKGFVQLMQTKMDQEHVDIMLSELDRINQIVSEFLVLAKPHKQELKVVNINGIVNKVISIVETQTNLKNIQVVLKTNGHLPTIKCEENQLKQVFLNLFKNAIEAIDEKGKILVETELADANYVKVRIEDNGCGISNDVIQRLGEPFFTTKETGTGLGLMVSQSIIQNHGGKLNILSELQKGTIVEVVLPIYINHQGFIKTSETLSKGL